MEGEVMAKKVTTKKKEETEELVKTYKLFLEMMKEDTEGWEHEFVKCFPGKILALDDKGNGWFRYIKSYKGRDGMVYVTKVLGETRLAVILTDGSFMMTSIGDYRQEYGWHIMDNDDGYMVIEETENWEDAFCAELSWRLWWERYQEEERKKQMSQQEISAEILRRLLGL